jgi:hypothetical protein
MQMKTQMLFMIHYIYQSSLTALEFPSASKHRSVSQLFPRVMFPFKLCFVKLAPMSITSPVEVSSFFNYKQPISANPVALNTISYLCR